MNRLIGKGCALALLLGVLLFGAGKWLSDRAAYEERRPQHAPPTSSKQIEPVPSSPSSPEVALELPEAGRRYSVPTDPSATYRLVLLRRMPNGNLETVTVRTGETGSTYARREIDCAGRQLRYLGEGADLNAAMSNGSNIGEMATVIEGSSSAVGLEIACMEDLK